MRFWKITVSYVEKSLQKARIAVDRLVKKLLPGSKQEMTAVWTRTTYWEKSRWIGDKSVKEGENKGRVKDDA